MRLVNGGPDLPLELLQALEDGKLIFFCGAGVSYRASLPGFKSLVDLVYARLHEGRRALEETAFQNEQYDRVLGLLEERILPKFVRRAVSQILELKLDSELGTHRSVLTLATTREGVCRLVTTNFDRGFELADTSRKVAIDAAPRLPVAKASGWSSVVHLHGKISDEDPDGRTLVLTSADFGAAYLTEGWAGRFLSELFRAYTVLFVGYSIGDPVVRYMLDAFAADRTRGDVAKDAYVFAATQTGDLRKDEQEWHSKGVKPLLYDPAGGHQALHQSLERWAELHRNGLLGKKSLITQYGPKVPARPHGDDPEVSQVLWALREPSGYVAREFALMDPLPPIQWLEVLEQSGLLSLNVVPSFAGDEKGLQVPLVDGGARNTNPPSLHRTSYSLGQWLARHLAEETTISWVLRSGSCLHPDFAEIVRRRLEEADLSEGARLFWTIVSAETSTIYPKGRCDAFHLRERIKSEGWSLSLKISLTDALTPLLRLRTSVIGALIHNDKGKDAPLSRFADVDIVLSCNDRHNFLCEAIMGSPEKESILQDLADDVTSHLKRAMELFDLCQQAGPSDDKSRSALPSIRPHPQNHGFHNWTVLIELCRDCWHVLYQSNRPRAKQLVERWRIQRYPVFRRLVYYAMADSDLYEPRACLEYLLDNGGDWLWSIATSVEKFQLLRAVWPVIEEADASRLADAILKGPSRSLVRSYIAEDEYQNWADRKVWLLLAKLEAAGRALPEPAASMFRELSKKHPMWELQTENRDEFSVWIEGGSGELLPEKPDEFVDLDEESLVERIAGPNFVDDADIMRWRRLVESNPARAAAALSTMADRSAWNSDLWNAALQTSAFLSESGRLIAKVSEALLPAVPSFLNEILRPTAWFLREASTKVEIVDEKPFWDLWDRVALQLFQETAKGDADDSLSAALNSTAGHLTEALLQRTDKYKPKANSDLPEAIWERLTKIATGKFDAHRLGRMILAARLAWLHSLDAEWTEEKLLPFFDWTNPPEAARMWQGFLWTVRITPELWALLKQSFLSAFQHMATLGEFKDRLSELLGWMAINRPGWLTETEARGVLSELTADGRATVAREVWRTLKGAADQSETLWQDRVSPWLDHVWPKDLSFRSADATTYLALAVTYSGVHFSKAVDGVLPYLTAAADDSLLMERLAEIGSAQSQPEATLKLLAQTVDTNEPWANPKLRTLLNQVNQADPSLSSTPEFRKLDEFLIRKGR